MNARWLLAVLLLCCVAATAKLPPPSVEFKGDVAAITEKDVTIKGKNTTRVFLLYPGTVLGKGGKQKISDFKPGTHVVVVFSESLGVYKVENIRTDVPPKPKPKAPAKPPVPPKKK